VTGNAAIPFAESAGGSGWGDGAARLSWRRCYFALAPGRGSRGSAGAVWPLESPPCPLLTPR
jgi:hypothetical protein